MRSTNFNRLDNNATTAHTVTAQHCNTLQHTATRGNTLQHTATHCNTLQHTATHCNTLQHTCRSEQHARKEAQHFTIASQQACETLQDRVASQLARLANAEAEKAMAVAQLRLESEKVYPTLQHIATNCNALHHSTTQCNTRHHIAAHVGRCAAQT